MSDTAVGVTACADAMLYSLRLSGATMRTRSAKSGCADWNVSRMST